MARKEALISNMSDEQTGEKMSEAQRSVDEFWPEVTKEMQRIKHVEPGNQMLPLARIKKIMKLDEDVKMISAEAPLLFAKAAELFIQELSLRAWLHTEDNKRRTLQRSDIAMAIAKYDQFDFLIDIVPREEIKSTRRDYDTKSSTDDVQYYLQLAQQHKQALQSTSESTSSTAGPSTSGTNIVQVQTSPVLTQQIVQQPHIAQQTASLQAQTPQIATITSPTAQNIILANPVQGTTSAVPTTANTITPTQINQPFQVIQQVLTPNGEVTHIPIPLTQNQLSFIRSQMQMTSMANTNSQSLPQSIMIHPTQLQQTPTIIQTAPAGMFLNAAQLQHPQSHAHIIQQSPNPTMVQQHQPPH